MSKLKKREYTLFFDYSFLPLFFLVKNNRLHRAGFNRHFNRFVVIAVFVNDNRLAFQIQLKGLWRD